MYKKILTLTLIILVALGLGIFIGTKIPKKISTQEGDKQDSYQAGWDAARERLSKSPIGIVGGIEIKSVSGTIQKIDSNKLTVKINALDPLADPSLDTRIITVDSNTKITLLVQKDQEQFQKEMQEFQDKMNVATEQDSTQPVTPIMPPAPFEKRDIKASDLKENQQITATANDNIKEKKEFAAIEIEAQEILITPSVQNVPAPMPPVNVPVNASAPIAPDVASQSASAPVMPNVAPNVE